MLCIWATGIGAALQEATVRPLFMQVCCSMTCDYEICWTFIALVCSTIYCDQKSPHLRVKENSVISGMGQFCGLASNHSCTARTPLHLLKLGKGNAEGHSQRLFMELLWCADWQLIFPRYNVKLWATRWTLRRATCELCCLVIPPLAAVAMWGGSLYCTAGIRPQLSCQNKCSSQEKTTLSDTLCCSAAGLNVISTLYGFQLCCRTLYDNFNIYLINY